MTARAQAMASTPAPRARVSRSLPARYPANGTWPAEMRIDTAAAFFDYATTGEFMKAVARREAPRPTAERMRNGKLEPVWALDICRAYIAARHEIKNDGFPAPENIGRLL